MLTNTNSNASAFQYPTVDTQTTVMIKIFFLSMKQGLRMGSNPQCSCFSLLNDEITGEHY